MGTSLGFGRDHPHSLGVGSAGPLWFHFSPGSVSAQGMEASPGLCDPASSVSLPQFQGPLNAKLWGVLDPLRTSLGRPDPIRHDAVSVDISSLAG